MDDDLRAIATLLAKPEPSREVADRSRERLLEKARGRRTRLGWAAGGIGLSAGAAAAVVLLSRTAEPVPEAAAPPSARQILYVAAAAAERMTAGSGTYWHVKTVTSSFSYETWTRRGGRAWLRSEKTGGAVEESHMPAPFHLAGDEVSVAELERLPADPAALKAFITRKVKNSDVRTSLGRPPADWHGKLVFAALTSLVSQLPAPPKVRAAALRALATLPDVRSLGAVEGGHGLQFSKARPVVDPATSRVRGTSFFVTSDGAEFWMAEGTTATIVAGWTDDRPR